MKTNIFSLSRSAAAIVLPFLLSATVVSAAPSISAVTPNTATSNTPVTMTASVSSPVGIQSCHLYVDLEDVGEMTVTGGTASRSFTFASGGSRIAFVFCRDASSGMASGPNTSIWVNGAIVVTPPLDVPEPTPEPTPAPAPTPIPEPVVVTPVVTNPVTPPVATTVVAGTLVKLPCPDGAEADHVCKAVYYYGADGKRHAFPNSRTYFTWYADFSQVTEITPDAMGTLPLGSNVTYRPGVRLVKFVTLDKVYAVGLGGVLRWVKTEDVARGLYGETWATQVDDIADAFYGNYTFGADVEVPENYQPSSETAAAASIDADR